MNKENFLSVLDFAIEDKKGIRVAIRMPDLEELEIITNPYVNVQAKREYYDKAYDENMKLKTFDKIEVVYVMTVNKDS